jgi:hypothetical protein
MNWRKGAGIGGIAASFITFYAVVSWVHNYTME